MNNQPFPPGSHLVAYLRDSGGDEQDLSIAQQEQAVNAWSHEHGYILTHVYTDEARPGSTTIGRDAFQAMLNHFRDPGCQEVGVVVWKLSRFARSIDDAQFYRADLRRRGFEVYSLNDNVPTGLDGRFFESAIDWLNERYLSDLSADVKRGMYHIVQHYGAAPFRAPLGFKREPLNLGLRRDGSIHVAHRLVPDDEIASTIRQAFELRAAGASQKRIRAETGLPISHNLSKMFNNRLYLGELHFGELTIPNYCEPIVDRELWNQVQTRRRSNDNPRRKGGTFLLSGLAYCIRCGSILNGHVVRSARLGSSWEYYVCSRNVYPHDCHAPGIPKPVLEAAIQSEMRAHILTPDILAELQDELRARHAELSAEAGSGRKRARRELAALRKKIGNLTDTIAKIGYSRNLVTVLSELEYRERELLAELERLDRLDSPQPTLEFSPTELAARLTAALDKASLDELKEIYGNIVARIDIEREGKHIRGSISFHAPYVFEVQHWGLYFRRHNWGYTYNRLSYSIARIEEI